MAGQLTFMAPPEEVEQAGTKVGLAKLMGGSIKGLRDFSLRRPGSDSTITGALWLPPSGEVLPETPLLLCGHGGSGHRYQQPIPFFARHLAARGIAVMAIDGPVHGLREQKAQNAEENEYFKKLGARPTAGQAALNEHFNRHGYGNVVKSMVEDWQAALAAVREETKIKQGRMGYYGLSMGSIFGVPLCAEIPFDVAALGLFGSEGPTPDYKAQGAKILCPVTYSMQLQDELFTRKGYLDMFDAIGSKDKRLHAHPGKHGQQPREDVEYIKEFLAEHLLGKGVAKI